MSDTKKSDEIPPSQNAVSGHAIHLAKSKRFVRTILVGLTILAIWLCAPARYVKVGYRSCHHLPGASDTLVIMKTGVTEIAERLPVHLRTTLTCPPNTIIFSDHEEMFDGKYKVNDVLANMSPDILRENDDFQLYRRVKEVGRLGLQPEDLTGVRTTTKTTDKDKKLVPGWVLDRYKFIPMMNETYSRYPNMKWYVFMESDTFIFWSTLLKYVSTLDHKKPHVIGHRTTRLAEHRFMQGGAGYLLSHEALRLVYHHIQAHHEGLDEWMEDEWAGDISLGAVFNDVGVPLTYAWPIFSPAFFGVIDFDIKIDGRRFWCFPAGTFHHMTPEAIEDAWAMEQRWIKEDNEENNPYRFLSHADVFNNLLLPRMRFPRGDWDNQCAALKTDITTLEECKQTCVDDRLCMQYLFDPNLLECRTSNIIRYGEPKLGSKLYSDWMFDRIERWRDNQAPCVRESYLRFGDIDLDL